MAFPDKLRQLRKANNLTQAALATNINTNVRTIRHYEAGTSAPSMAALAKIATYFKIDANYLLDLSDDPSPPEPAASMPTGRSDRE